MKIPILTCVALLIAVFTTSGQTVPDPHPILIGQPSYTMLQSAIDAGIRGKVRVAIHVDEKGVPTQVTLLSEPMWPCGTSPTQALDELSSTLSSEMMKLRFQPAFENRKAVAKDVSLEIDLKKPKSESEAANIDPATGKVKTLSGPVENGRATSLPQPVYPKEAKKKHVHGSVTVSILIDEEGKVLSAGAVDGPIILQSSARDAACKSTYTPTLFIGKPVKVMAVITYNFTP